VATRELTKRDTGEEWGFGETDKEAADGKSGTVSHGRHADGTDTPGHHHGWEKPSGVGFGKPQVTGDLANEVSDVEG